MQDMAAEPIILDTTIDMNLRAQRKEGYLLWSTI